MIRITAKQEGFRRCGIAHSKQPTEYPDDRFNADELEQLNAEANLVVEIANADKRPNVKESTKLVAAAETLEDLDQLAAGEDRKGVLDAIDKRRAELTEPQGE
jgi:hypothetical protein